jgi:hypothetical protein
MIVVTSDLPAASKSVGSLVGKSPFLWPRMPAALTDCEIADVTSRTKAYDLALQAKPPIRRSEGEHPGLPVRGFLGNVPRAMKAEQGGRQNLRVCVYSCAPLRRFETLHQASKLPHGYQPFNEIELTSRGDNKNATDTR